MPRIINAAAAQMGPISRSETRKDAVCRLLALMREAKGLRLVDSCLGPVAEVIGDSSQN